MAQDQFSSYGDAVDDLVDEIVAARDEQSADDRLLGLVNAYADRARDVLDVLLELPVSEATTARLLALAAGDFRLAASLVVVDTVPVEEDDERAQQYDLREELANLSDDMEEIKAAVIDEPEGSDGGGGSRAPRPNVPSPSNPDVPKVVFPWLEDPVATPAYAAAWETASAAGPAEAANRFVIRGGAPGPTRVQLVAKEIDKIVDNAAGQIGGLVIGGVPFAVESAAELSELAAGFLPQHYQAFQETLTGLARRAKRAAVKLLYEALEKLLRIFRSAIPQDSPVPVASALVELVDWLVAFALKTKIRNGLERALQVDALQSHAIATLGALPAFEAESRATSVWAVGNAYGEKKIQLPIDCGRVALRACRVFKLQHVAPPVSQIVVGCVTLGLCGLSGWLAQDFLDHPSFRFVPQRFHGVLSAVDGRGP
jgi:hypothetical protein